MYRYLVQMVTRCLERRASMDMSADQITYRHYKTQIIMLIHKLKAIAMFSA